MLSKKGTRRKDLENSQFILQKIKEFVQGVVTKELFYKAIPMSVNRGPNEDLTKNNDLEDDSKIIRAASLISKGGTIAPLSKRQMASAQTVGANP